MRLDFSGGVLAAAFVAIGPAALPAATAVFARKGGGGRRCPGARAVRPGRAGQPGCGQGRIPRSGRRAMVGGGAQRPGCDRCRVAHRCASPRRDSHRRRHDRPRRRHRDRGRQARPADRRDRPQAGPDRSRHPPISTPARASQADIPRGGVWLLQPGRYDIDAGGGDRPVRIAAYTGNARFVGGGADISDQRRRPARAERRGAGCCDDRGGIGRRIRRVVRGARGRRFAARRALFRVARDDRLYRARRRRQLAGERQKRRGLDAKGRPGELGALP